MKTPQTLCFVFVWRSPPAKLPVQAHPRVLGLREPLRFGARYLVSTAVFRLLWGCYRFDVGLRGLSDATLVLAGSRKGDGEDRCHLGFRKAAP